MIYLDHNSTTPIAPQVAEAMAACYREGYANPASQHAPGRRARRTLEVVREGILTLLGASTTGMDADQLIFTSGGTEANNLALFGLCEREVSRWEGEAPAKPARRILISSVEHPSVVGPAEELARRGWTLQRIQVTRDGVIDIAHARQLLARDPQSLTLVSVMLANNETGVLQPVREIASGCHGQPGIVVHTDAVQVAGKLPIRFRDLGVDALSITAHKFHGPRGIGALVLRHGMKLQPLLYGGFQQAGLRPGTEDVALASGMLTALRLWQQEGDERAARMTELRDRLEEQLRAGDPTIVINGRGAARLPHTSNVSFPGLNRQALLMALDQAGVACSTGSACASGSSEPSPVLIAMGCESAVIEGALRLSLGAATTRAAVDEAARRILACANDLRQAKNREFAAATGRHQSPKSL